MSITFYPAVEKPMADGRICMTWVDGLDEDDFINVSNANGAGIIRALGYCYDPEMGGLSSACAREFVARSRQYLRQHLDAPSPEIPVTDTQAPGQARMIDCGRREGYLEQRIHQIMVAVQRGIEVGATHVYAA